MRMWRKGLSLLCGLTALLVAGNWLFFAVNQEASQVIWDYVADPAVLVLLGLTVLVNVRDSLQVRNNAGTHLTQLPRDIITALEAMVGFRYLLQYVDKMAASLEPVDGLWAYLDSIVVVVLVAEAIALWRSANRTD
ncbi:MAG: hypothetical protein F4Y37_01280 [Caldilineaceae bacterium SB0664_bin_22]|nr:hypothetical protein [Caldilineaceae bacterium SB0664_bin_22]